MTQESSVDENQLDESIYQKLKAIANNLMRQEQQGHTLSPTDLVHEAYLKLSDTQLDLTEEKAYLFILARQMRRLLVDYGRRKRSVKHGGQVNQVYFTESLNVAGQQLFDFTGVSAAIDELESVSERCAKIIELYYFIGIGREKIALLMNISQSTLAREVHFAKAFIGDYLNES